MNISLTPEQEKQIETKLRSGKYRDVNDILATALQLLDEYERSNAEWVEDVRTKIDAAISASEDTPPIDGENFVKQIVAEFRQT